MKKRIMYLMIVLCTTFLLGCENNNSSLNPKQEENSVAISTNSVNNSSKINTENTENKKVEYNIPNDGGKFSNNDLIYFILTDRFYDGDESNNDFKDVNKNNPKTYHGGDLKGIIEKLDYIKSIGATAIWITPVVDNEPFGYHGYWTYDFYNVDEHLGEIEDLKKLVEESHKRDMKVILDFVVNHTGYTSPWLSDSTKRDWFHKKLKVTNWNDQYQVENGQLSGLPDLNQQNPEVSEYLIDNALWWIEQTKVDGMRLDTVKHVQKEFWADFTNAIKTKYPDFYLLGEVWDENPRYCETYHEVGIDGITNYSLYSGIRKAFTRFGKTTSLTSALKREKYYSNPDINGIFIDNHDNTRLISAAGDHGEEYLKQALTFIMTYPAIPVVYYGTEIGLEGMSDPDNRRDMIWTDIENNEIYNFYNSLINLRKTNPALISGDFQLLDYDNYFLSYIRQADTDSVIVIMNVQNKEKTVTVNIPDSITDCTDLLSNKTFNPIDGKLNLTLKPLDLIILGSSNNKK